MKELKPVCWQFRSRLDGEWKECNESDIDRFKSIYIATRALYAIPEGYALVPVAEIESAANALAYGAHPHESPHAKSLREYLKDATFPPGSVVDEEV